MAQNVLASLHVVQKREDLPPPLRPPESVLPVVEEIQPEIVDVPPPAPERGDEGSSQPYLRQG